MGASSPSAMRRSHWNVDGIGTSVNISDWGKISAVIGDTNVHLTEVRMGMRKLVIIIAFLLFLLAGFVNFNKAICKTS